MKVEVSAGSDKNLPYPKLMMGSGGLIVLFSESEEGVVIVADQYYVIGYYTNDWTMTYFRDFEGTITLSND